MVCKLNNMRQLTFKPRLKFTKHRFLITGVTRGRFVEQKLYHIYSFMCNQIYNYHFYDFGHTLLRHLSQT